MTDTPTRHDQHGRYARAETVDDFRHNLAAVQAIASQTMRGAPGPGGVYAMNATFQEILTDERIVYSYELLRDDLRLSVSLATIEFRREGAGTRLIFTEQAAFLDGHDKPDWREQGSRIGFDRLADYLALEQAPA